MEPLSRKDLTLLALAFARGQVLTRIYLQKAVLVLQEVLDREFGVAPNDPYHFAHHNYGGYAPEIYQDAIYYKVRVLS